MAPRTVSPTAPRTASPDCAENGIPAPDCPPGVGTVWARVNGIPVAPASAGRGGGGASAPCPAKGIADDEGVAAMFASVLCLRNPNVGACWCDADGGGGGGTPAFIGATVPGSFCSKGVPASDERAGIAPAATSDGGIAPGLIAGRTGSGSSAVSAFTHSASGSIVSSSAIIPGTRGGGATSRSGTAVGDASCGAGASDFPERRNAPSRGPLGTSGGNGGSGVEGARRPLPTTGGGTAPSSATLALLAALPTIGNGASPRTLANVSSSSKPVSSAAAFSSGGWVGSSTNGSAAAAASSPSTAIVSWTSFTSCIHAGTLACGPAFTSCIRAGALACGAVFTSCIHAGALA